MGDEDVVYTGSSSNYCNDQRNVKDCDGDWFTLCDSNSSCPYKSDRRDCDGDWMSVCLK